MAPLFGGQAEQHRRSINLFGGQAEQDSAGALLICLVLRLIDLGFAILDRAFEEAITNADHALQLRLEIPVERALKDKILEETKK